MRKSGGLIVSIVLGVVLIAGLAHLFALRFERGDVYPAYSSYRADPLGTRALLDTLDDFPQLRVERHLKPLSETDIQPGDTIFIAGLPTSQVIDRPLDAPATDGPPPVSLEWVRRAAMRGARVVIALPPTDVAAEPSAGFDPDPTSDDTTEDGSYRVPQVLEPWDIRIGTLWLRGEEDAAFHISEADASVITNPIDWKSTRYFKNLPDVWRPVYLRSFDLETDLPVIIERQVGRGSIVLSADSYFLSNEGLRQDPRPALLAWLIGDARRVVFDESHLGVQVRDNLASTIRRVGFHWPLVGLIGLAALFAWRSVVRLVPPDPEARQRLVERIAGRDASSGMANLLRRSVPPRELMSICLQQWRETAAAGHPRAAQHADQLTDIIERHRRDPVAAYRAAAQALQRKDTAP